MRLRLEEDIGRHGAKKEVSDGVTAGFFFKGVRVIAIQVQQHVVCTVSGFGTGMSHQIVEKFGDILIIFLLVIMALLLVGKGLCGYGWRRILVGMVLRKKCPTE